MLHGTEGQGTQMFLQQRTPSPPRHSHVPRDRQTKVSDTRHPTSIENDVSRLYVSVDNWRMGMTVRVLDGMRHAKEHIDAYLPRHHHWRQRGGAMIKLDARAIAMDTRWD